MRILGYYILSGENTVYITHKGETINNYVQSYNNFTNPFVFLPSSVNFNGKTYTVDGLYGAFYGCDAYDEVIVPDTYTYIGPSSFEGCTRLAQINIPEGVTCIDYKAFMNTALTDVVIPSTVTEIGMGAFATTTGTSPITSVTCLATTPPYVYQVINKSGQLNYWYEYDVWNGETYTNAPLNVPKNCKSAYQSAYDWSDFSNIYENAYDFEVDGIYYNITNSSTNTVAVTYRDTRYNSYSGNVYIPNTVSYNGTTYTVTTIGAHAFRGCTELTYVNMMNGITLIGYCAFYNCPALDAVTVPNSVTTIGNYAFYACRSLKTVAIGTDISCACTSIGNYAFYGCTALGNSDGSGSFTCMALTPPTVSEYTFGSHDVQWGLDNYISAVERYAKLYTPYSATNTYKSSSSGWRYFYNANNPRWEFYKYPYRYIISGENTVYITHIGKTVNDYTVSYNNASATLPTSVTFNDKTYTVNGLYGAFYGCYALENVTIPDTYTYIGPSSFEGCTSLTQINIPEGVTYIGYKAFMNTGLTDVVIPSTVTEVGLGAFATTSGTSPIQTVTCLATTPPYVYQAINKSGQLNSWYEYDVWNGETYSNAPLYVPRGCKSAYQSAYDWKNFATIYELAYDFMVNGIYYKITGTNTVEVCRKFADNSYKTYSGKINIPATVTYNGTTYNVTAIGEMAFYLCSDVTSISLPSSITSIGAWSIEGTGITSIGIPSSVTNIGDYAFFGCTNLKSITIPNNVSVIGRRLFYNCSSLEVVTLGSGITSIGEKAFYGCTSVKDFTCMAVNPPDLGDEAFPSNFGIVTKFYVPSAQSAQLYHRSTDWSAYIFNITLKYVLNSNLNFTTSGHYPWTNVTANGRTYAQSSNGGVQSSTSSMSLEVTAAVQGSISFDFKAWGEGGPTEDDDRVYDKCQFLIDGVAQFTYGALQNDWETYTATIPAGTHTLTWSYTKDYSVNESGDYFAVDNVVLTLPDVQPGDVNGDGDVTIADVSGLIDLLLEGTGPYPPGADVNGDNNVTIADVSALIDILLGL